MSHLPLLELTGEPVRFSSAVLSHLGGEEQDGPQDQPHSPFLGKVCRRGNIAVIAKGANLDVVSLPSNERLSAWSFGTDLEEPETEITCLLPFSSDPSSKAPSHVLVGLDSGLQGLLAVFDIQECRVTRCISLPHQVSSLALVSPAGGPSVPPFLHPALLYYHGLVAVGVSEGRLLLIDLALDEAGESTDSSPAGVFFIRPGSRDVARLRTKAIAESTHLVLEVAPYTHEETFTWDQVSFPADKVMVSALHYCPQLASLAVGYNTGTWGLVSLLSLAPEYSSPYSQEAGHPVTQLVWQEPLDDPRHYSYYWVVRGDGRALATATVYSLSYRDRQWDLSAGPLYAGLDSVAPRWHHELNCPGGEAASSQVVSVAALELPLGDRAEASEIEQQLLDLGLVVLAWTVPGAAYLGVFDINCWYQAQMPASVGDGEELCSYFSYSELESEGPPSLLDISVDTDTLAKFGWTGSQVEQHFQPSSLKFSVVALLPQGWMSAQHLGLQRKVLTALGRPGSLVSPSELYLFCLQSGLSQGLVTEVSLLTQRQALLTVALEHSMVGCVVAACRDWSDGKLLKAGCSLKFLLDWAWARVAAIKGQIDRQTLPLFDHSLVEVDGGSRGQLASLAGQLAQLVTVLSTLSAESLVTSSAGLEELEIRLSVTGLVLLYTQAISWFVNVGLLPEQPEGPNSPFPVSLLEAQYREKRLRLAEQGGAFGRPGLLVDNLCEDIGDELVSNFQRAGGNGAYPPPSLHSLITSFLSESPAPAKLRLVQYFFLDLAHINPPDTWGDLVESLIKFPSAFSLPPSLIKLTQAFWLLDHEDWEEAVAMMLDPLLQDDDLTAAHHRTILVSLLSQGQHALALKYSRIRRPPLSQPEDVQLHISVLLANGAIQEAFTFQRSRRGSANSASLLSSFYRRAEELGKLDSVLQLSLGAGEEREFVIFLQTAARQDSQEVLLMYYLQRARFTEAMQLNHSMASVQGRSSARQAIMERYNHILPGLATSFGVKRISLMPGDGRAPCRPVPLSVTLQNRNIRLQSHATLIEQKLNTPKVARDVTSHTPFRRQRGGEGITGLIRGHDLTKSCKRLRGEQERSVIAFPTDTTLEVTTGQENSSRLESFAYVSPPTKRTRLSDVSSLNMSVKSIRRMSIYRGAEALSILNTPTISKKRLSRLSPRRSTLVTATPQSILKVKQLIRETPQEEKPFLDVSLHLEDTGTLTPSREGTPGKSLRFREPRKVPASAPPPPPGGVSALEDSPSSAAEDASQDSFHSAGMEVDSSPEVRKSPKTSSLASQVDSSPEVRRSSKTASLAREGDTCSLSKALLSRQLSTSALDRVLEQSEEPREPQKMSRQTSTAAALDQVLERAGNSLREKEGQVRQKAAVAARQVVEEEKKRREGQKLLEVVEKVAREKEVVVRERDVVVKEEVVKEQTELVKEKEAVIKAQKEVVAYFKEEEAVEKLIVSEQEEAETEEYSEDEDEAYYDQKSFARKECDITLEDSDDEKKTSPPEEDEEEDEEEAYFSQRGAFKRKECDIVLEDQDQEEVVELDDTTQSSEEGVVDMNVSWAASKVAGLRKSGSEVIQEIIKEEKEASFKLQSTTVSASPQVSTTPPGDAVSTPNKSLSVDTTRSSQDEVDLNFSWEEQRSSGARKEAADSVLQEILAQEAKEQEKEEQEAKERWRKEKVAKEAEEILQIIADEDDEEVIAIDSDEDEEPEPVAQTAPSKPAFKSGAVLFSSFHDSTGEEAEVLEVSEEAVEEIPEDTEVAEVEEEAVEDILDADTEVVDEAVEEIFEADTEVVDREEAHASSLASKTPAASLLLFSTFGGAEEEVEPAEEKDEDHDDVDDLIGGSEEEEEEEAFTAPGVEQEEEESPVYYEKYQDQEQVQKEASEEEEAMEESMEGVEESVVVEGEENMRQLLDRVTVPESSGEMRQLLDYVSTCATRASSIAGSIFGDSRREPLSSPATPVPWGPVVPQAEELPGPVPTFAFADPGTLQQGPVLEDEAPSDDGSLQYNFSTPLDSSQVEDLVEERTEGQAQKKVFKITPEEADKKAPVSKPFFQLIHEEEAAEDDDDEEADEDEDDDADDDSDEVEEEEEEEDGAALDFSWTKVAAPAVVDIQDLVQEEQKAEQSLAAFSAPTVESEEVLEEEVGGEEFQFGAPNDESMVDEEEDEEEYQAADVVDAEEEDTKDQKQVVEEAPATPKRSSTRKTPGPASETPRRVSARKVSQSRSLLLETPAPLLLEVGSSSPPRTPGGRRSGRNASTASTIVLEEQEVMSSPGGRSAGKEAGRAGYKLLTKTASTASTVVLEEEEDEVEDEVEEGEEKEEMEAGSSSTIAMETSSGGVRKTKVSSGLQGLVLDSPRRSGRRASVVKEAVFDTLQLRNRTVEEVFSPVDELGQEVKKKEAVYDTLELRNRTVEEVFSPVAEFGQDSKEKIKEAKEQKEMRGVEAMETSVSRRRSGRRSVSSPITQPSPGQEKGAKEQEAPVKEQKEVVHHLLVTDTSRSRQRSVSTPVTRSSPKQNVKKVAKEKETGDKEQEKVAKVEAREQEKVVKEQEKEVKEKEAMETSVSRRSGRRSVSSPVTRPSPQQDRAASPITSTRKRKVSARRAASEEPAGAPMTPLKRSLAAALEDSAKLQLTPSRRSRRISGSLDDSAAPLTPSRRSRRLSGVEPETAPDGGLITGGTPRPTPGTPRTRRHTSVRAGDVEVALGLAPQVLTPALPVVIEEEEAMESASPPAKRGRRPLKSEEEEVKMEEEETSAGTSKDSKPKAVGKKKAASGYKSRRKTITTLGADVDLFQGSPGVEQEQEVSPKPAAKKAQKKYIPIKKKTKVRIV